MLDTTIRLDGGQLLTETETANILNMTVATLRRWRWSGDGPRFRKIGSSVRYHPADLEQFIEAAARLSTSDESPEAV